MFLVLAELSTFASPGKGEERAGDVCAQSGSGKRFGSVSKPPPFFFFPPLVPIDNHEPVQPAAKRGTSTRDGLIELAWQRSPFYFAAGFSFSDFYRRPRTAKVYACRFSRAFRISTTRSSNTHISHVFFSFLFRRINVGRRPIKASSLIQRERTYARDDLIIKCK